MILKLTAQIVQWFSRAFLCYTKYKITSYHSFCCCRPISTWRSHRCGSPCCCRRPWCWWRFCCSFPCCFWRSCCCWLSCCFWLLANASVPADPGVYILVAILQTVQTVQIVQWDNWTIGISEYDYQTAMFFFYRTIGISNIRFANSRNYRISDQGLNLSDYRTHTKLAVAQLWYFLCAFVSRKASAVSLTTYILFLGLSSGLQTNL